MSTQKLINRNRRKLTKLGKKSLGVTLPIEFIKELGWREKQRIKITRIRGGLVIKDLKS